MRGIRALRSALDAKSPPRLLPTCIPISCGRRKPACCTRLSDSTPAALPLPRSLFNLRLLQLSSRCIGGPSSRSPRCGCVTAQAKLDRWFGMSCSKPGTGAEHTLTYGRRRMAFLLGLSSCNSNPPLHARRLVSNLIGEWNKDGERASEGGRPDGRTGEPLHKFPAKVTAPLLLVLHLGQTISTAFFVVAYFRAE